MQSELHCVFLFNKQYLLCVECLYGQVWSVWYYIVTLTVNTVSVASIIQYTNFLNQRIWNLKAEFVGLNFYLVSNQHYKKQLLPVFSTVNMTRTSLRAVKWDEILRSGVHSHLEADWLSMCVPVCSCTVPIKMTCRLIFIWGGFFFKRYLSMCIQNGVNLFVRMHKRNWNMRFVCRNCTCYFLFFALHCQIFSSPTDFRLSESFSRLTPLLYYTSNCASLFSYHPPSTAIIICAQVWNTSQNFFRLHKTENSLFSSTGQTWCC